MIVGFTGTQEGMTAWQQDQFADVLRQLDPDQFHFGDCIGADQQAFVIVRAVKPNCLIVLHPPLEWRKRAFCTADVSRPPKAYLVRNHDIVTESDVLVAAPKTLEEELRSGTWATVRYARKIGREVIMLTPS